MFKYAYLIGIFSVLSLNGLKGANQNVVILDSCFLLKTEVIDKFFAGESEQYKDTNIMYGTSVNSTFFWIRYWNPVRFMKLLIRRGHNRYFHINVYPPKWWYKEKYIVKLKEKFKKNVPCAGVTNQMRRERGLSSKSKGSLFEVEKVVYWIESENRRKKKE